MPHSELQVFILASTVAIYVAAFANGFFICFHGIRYMDYYFSDLKNYRLESSSPFDRLARMHSYSFGYTFGLKKKKLSRPMHYWLYFTSVSLSLHWALFAGACIAYYAGFDPLLVFTFGIA